MGAFELRFDGLISLVTLLFNCNSSAVTVLCLTYKYILRPNYCLRAHVLFIPLRNPFPLHTPTWRAMLTPSSRATNPPRETVESMSYYCYLPKL
jgi:hypothetical protein